MSITEPEARVVAVLADRPSGRGATYDEIAAAIHTSYDAVQRVVPGLIDAGFISRFGGGVPYLHAITYEGRKLIQEAVYRDIRDQVTDRANL